MQNVALANVAVASRHIAVSCRQLTKRFGSGQQSVDVLSDVSFDIPEGSFRALMGPSGSGKTTLLNLLAGLDRATSGSIDVDGTHLTQLSNGQLSRWRAANVGIIFQEYNLLPVLSAVENVRLPLALTKLSAKECRKRALEALDIVGLSARASHRPAQLSGGQQQRVAIARAIVCDPKLVLADEPTGNLDRQSAREALDLLQTLHTDLGKTIIMVTHDPDAAARAEQVMHLNKGVLT